MATHSIVPAWRVPGMEEPGGPPSMGSHRVGHDWSDLAAAAAAAASPTLRKLFFILSDATRCKVTKTESEAIPGSFASVHWMFQMLLCCYCAGGPGSLFPDCPSSSSASANSSHSANMSYTHILLLHTLLLLSGCSFLSHLSSEPFGLHF